VFSHEVMDGKCLHTFGRAQVTTADGLYPRLPYMFIAAPAGHAPATVPAKTRANAAYVA
jgi:hypothetical protein